MTIEVFSSGTAYYPPLTGSAVNSGTSTNFAYLYPDGSFTNIGTEHLKAPAPTTKVNAIAAHFLPNAPTGTGKVRYELYKNGIATGIKLELTTSAAANTIHKASFPSGEVSYTGGVDVYSIAVIVFDGTIAGGHNRVYVTAYYEAS